MNDFTKEELEDIRNSLGIWIRSENANPQSIISLRDKIQSMIDNYCEHMWTDGSGNNIFCAKCQMHAGKR